MNFPAVVLCLWAGAQATAAVPHPALSKVEQQQQLQPLQVTEEVLSLKARAAKVTITTTKTMTQTRNITVSLFATCTKVLDGVSPCPAPRSLPLANFKPAKPDIMIHMTASPLERSTDKESHLEVGQLLVPSYISENYFVPTGRFFDYFFQTITEISRTNSTTTKVITDTTVSLTYGGCIPADAPTNVKKCS